MPEQTDCFGRISKPSFLFHGRIRKGRVIGHGSLINSFFAYFPNPAFFYVCFFLSLSRCVFVASVVISIHLALQAQVSSNVLPLTLSARTTVLVVCPAANMPTEIVAYRGRYRGGSCNTGADLNRPVCSHAPLFVSALARDTHTT